MQNTTLIEIKNLVKIYDGSIIPAIDNVSIDINEGAIFGLLGPNGAGKTTIISILCNLIPSTSGSVFIDGQSLASEKIRIKKITGVVLQDIALYDKLTTFENLRYFGTLYDIPPKDLYTRISTLLTRLGLEKFKDERVWTLSGGIKRRINLLAGVLHSPRILFLDEPTVGIDVQSRNSIIEFLIELNKSGTTIIYTSHMMEEAQRLCTRVAIIDYGKVIAVSSPNELISDNTDCHSLEDVFLKLTGRALRDDYQS